MNDPRLNQAGKAFNQYFLTGASLNPTYRPQNLTLINGVSAREEDRVFVSQLAGDSILKPKNGIKYKPLVSKTY